MTPHPAQAAAHVVFVGAGPGDPDLLTLAAAQWLRRADAVVVDQLPREEIIERHAPDGVTVIDAGLGEPGQALTEASRARRLVQVAKEHPGGTVVRLMDGDPATFNGLAGEALQLSREGIRFDVVPGVTAATAVPTYAGIPLTGADASAVHVISVGDERTDFTRSVDADVTVVVMGPPPALASALGHLLEDGRAPETPVALTENGTTHQQCTQTTTLAEAAAAVGQVCFPALAVVGPTVSMRSELSWFETKPLFGWNVLVPRTKEQSTGITQRLATYGATAEIVPTISVEPPRTPQQMERAVKGLVTGRYEWIGFTSVNAVRAVREKFDEFGLDARAFAGLKIAAVGGVTAKALADWGLTPDLVPTGEQSALGLLKDWPEYDELLDPINRVLLPRADIATETLVAGLKDMGWEVDDVTAYRTVRAAPPPAPTREAIKSGAFDAVVFTSSSTVRNLVGIAGKPHTSTVIACIGPATAKTAQEHGLRVDVLAPEASGTALVDALAQHGRDLMTQATAAGSEFVRPSQRRKKSTRRKSSAAASVGRSEG